MRIEYNEYLNSMRGLNLIKRLWIKLNEWHLVHSQNFVEFYSKRTFELRKKDFIKNSRSGALRVDLATESDTGELVGYCISTISADIRGVLESLYIEPNYRQHDIGRKLMERALYWMDGLSVKSKTLVVAAGNEEVFKFYRRYNFYPKNTKLEQLNN